MRPCGFPLSVIAGPLSISRLALLSACLGLSFAPAAEMIGTPAAATIPTVIYGTVRTSTRGVLRTSTGGIVRTSTSRALTPVEQWRLEAFGVLKNTGEAANTADADGDGLPNLIEYGIGSDPKDASPAPAWIARNGGYEITFTPPAGLPINYAAEWSATLAADDWHPADDISAPREAAKSFRVSTSASKDGKLFLRLSFSE